MPDFVGEARRRVQASSEAFESDLLRDGVASVLLMPAYLGLSRLDSNPYNYVAAASLATYPLAYGIGMLIRRCGIRNRLEEFKRRANETPEEVDRTRVEMAYLLERYGREARQFRVLTAVGAGSFGFLTIVSGMSGNLAAVGFGAALMAYGAFRIVRRSGSEQEWERYEEESAKLESFFLPDLGNRGVLAGFALRF